ncbi:MAG TPA: hypothetical protein VF712_02715 [Thermoleophilaceae bacterium]|jgi:hypothetical protein
MSAVAIAACGGGDGGRDPAAGDREKLEQAGLKHARCMREQGVDVPDPKPGEGGMILVGPAQGGSPAKQERAMRECEKYLRDLPPPRLSEEQKEEMRDAALAHARCMREQGIDFPDPTFGPDGSITVKVGPGELEPDDPKMQSAEKACAEHRPQLPGGGPEPEGAE